MNPERDIASWEKKFTIEVRPYLIVVTRDLWVQLMLLSSPYQYLALAGRWFVVSITGIVAGARLLSDTVFDTLLVHAWLALAIGGLYSMLVELEEIL
ncbi:hypothetical protein [Natrinema marinum]|uniref:hypothetical protein n=1 Tax=Natrinema marinum TaxID=2961598 RepID=UPI0020C85CD6|nr:hypothetical protein [Natrinema marinum]